MAAPAPAPVEFWKEVVRQRVVSAQDFVRRAQNELQVAKVSLETPVSEEILAQGPEVALAAFRLKLVGASGRLTEATLHLNSAAACMDAAELVSLHGGSRGHVALPLQSIDHLGPPDGRLRYALESLRESRAGALAAACEATMCCAGHLAMDVALVDNYPAMPDLFSYITADKPTVYGYLMVAVQRAATAWDEVTIALQNHLTPP